jgi:pimeloyl-ACP methyl ester carboxylesterase
MIGDRCMSVGNEFRRTMVATSHGRIAVDMREGDGPALMLLHGNSFSGAVFDRLRTSPAFARMPLIIPDLPGHGASDNASAPGRTYNYAGLAACMTELVEALDIETFVAFGWSLGGQVAIEMLDNAPGLIGVAACGSAVVQRGPLGLINGFHFTRDLLLAGKATLRDSDAGRFASVCVGRAASHAHLDMIQRTDEALRPALSRASLLGRGRDQRAAVLETRTPVCLMLGAHDPFIRAETLQGIKAPALFGGRVLMLKHSGHAPFLEASQAFDAALSSFCAHARAEAAYARPVAGTMRLAG